MFISASSLGNPNHTSYNTPRFPPLSSGVFCSPPRGHPHGDGTGWDVCPFGTHQRRVPCRWGRMLFHSSLPVYHPAKNTVSVTRVALSCAYFPSLIKIKHKLRSRSHTGEHHHVSHNAERDKEDLGPPSADLSSTHTFRRLSIIH